MRQVQRRRRAGAPEAVLVAEVDDRLEIGGCRPETAAHEIELGGKPEPPGPCRRGEIVLGFGRELPQGCFGLVEIAALEEGHDARDPERWTGPPREVGRRTVVGMVEA